MRESLWLPGTVADCYAKAGGAQWMPYQIDLDRGDACYAQSDDPRLIRNVGGAGEECRLACGSRGRENGGADSGHTALRLAHILYTTRASRYVAI